MGTDTIKLFTNVLEEIGKDKLNTIDIGYVKMCLIANQNNALTSYYYLLAKKMTIEGKPLVADEPLATALVPKEKAVKKY